MNSADDIQDILNRLRKEQQNKEWYENNKDHHYSLTKENWKKHYSNNINFRIAKVLRSRLYYAVKNTSHINNLGCSIEELKAHLEAQFEPGMSWDNYGDWHIDHTRPLSRFNLQDPKHVKIVCNYSNLQPLWAEDNRKKSNG